MIALRLGIDPSQVGPWSVNVDSEANTPDQTLTVYDTSPRKDGRSMLDGEVWLHYGFLIRIRALDAKTGYAKAASIHTTLAEQVYYQTVVIPSGGGVGAASYSVHSISPGGVIRLGKEKPVGKRSLFTINGLASLTRLS